MSVQEKQRAYDRYQGADTVGTKQGLHDPQSLHPQFVHFVNNWQNVDPTTVPTDHLGDVSFAKEAFYQTLMSETFHVNWSNANPNQRGPGNYLMVEVRRNDDGSYTFRHYGMTDSAYVITLEHPAVLLHNNSIAFEDGLVKALFRLTTNSVNGVKLWNYQVAINDRLRWNYYLAPINFN